MLAQDGINRLEPVLMKDSSGRMYFACRKARVIIWFQNESRRPIQFGAKDRIGFRADQDGLQIEELTTGFIRMRFIWRDLESVAAGEPETDGGSLFQG